MEAFQSKSSDERPVRIIGFNSEKEYAPYRASEAATAFYFNGDDHEYIVMSDLGAERYPAAVHEYTHLLMHQVRQEVPLWFNEGLAELYSTLKPMGNKVQVGAIIPGRYQVLHNEKWLDLATLLATDHKSPHYNEAKRAGIFYAESWALVHMLVLKKEYRLETSAFLRALDNGEDAEAALQRVYGMSLPMLQKGLEAYMRGDRFNAVLFDMKLSKAAETPTIEPADPAVVGAAMVDILNTVGKRDEAIAQARTLAAEYPRSAEVQRAWARAAWRAEHGRASAETLAHFAKAAELGSASVKMYVDYGRLLAQANDHAGAEKALRKAAALAPGSVEVSLGLAEALMLSGKYIPALRTLEAHKRITSKDAFSYYSISAYCYYRIEQPKDARDALTRAEKYAKEPAEQKRLAWLREAVAGQERNPHREAGLASSLRAGTPAERTESAGSPEPAGDPDPQPARLARRDAPAAREVNEAPALPAIPTVEGTLRQVDCRGSMAILRVESRTGAVALAIRDPQAVRIEDSTGGSVDMTCGPQRPPRRVRLGYAVGADPKLGTMGDVKTLRFL
jgi:tetratricopeptide (TPR) repeat protein